jgi:LysW-gamma-L-lysine carboxypeptidase
MGDERLTDPAIGLLEALVAIPSPSGQEREAVEGLVSWMSAHGLRAHIDAAGNAVGQAGTGARTVVLLGHIDTFGGMLPVRREGDLLHGRGTVDAKGALCAFAAAAARAHIPDGWRVVVIGAVEEECPTSAGAHYAVTQYAPQLCVIGEPSRWDRLTLGYKGRLIAEWRIHADLAHSANPTASPAELAFEAWGRVRALADRFNAGRESAFGRLLATLHAVNSGDDGVYGWASARFGFRLPPDLTPEQLEAEVRGVLNPSPPTPLSLRRLRAQGARGAEQERTEQYGARGAEPEQVGRTSPPSPPVGEGGWGDEGRLAGWGDEGLTFTAHTPTYAAPRDTDLSRAFRAAIRAEGGTPAFVYKTGTSDMNIAGPAWGCPILAYGAGDSALDHTPHEHIDLNEYLRAVRVLTRVLETLPQPETP